MVFNSVKVRFGIENEILRAEILPAVSVAVVRIICDKRASVQVG